MKHETQDSEALTLREEIINILAEYAICEDITARGTADNIIALIKSRLPEEINTVNRDFNAGYNQALKEVGDLLK